MSSVVIYYHDPIEVDLSTSWTGLCPALQSARQVKITEVTDRNVTALFDYARPDAVITVDGKPAVSVEQTRMNPSGHNIPQRFSSQLWAAELGVPSILYYPEYARRTFSDPNVRYLQVRVPMAQLRVTRTFEVPTLSVFWPTNSRTKLPETGQAAHREMADLVNSLVTQASDLKSIRQLPEVKRALERMGQVVAHYASRYRPNRSVRRLCPEGFSSAWVPTGVSVDPPEKVKLLETEAFIGSFAAYSALAGWPAAADVLRRRSLTLLLTGTTNKDGTDSEHPWPGYLTLIDVLYARSDGGRRPKDRAVNLVYRLPVPVDTFLKRANERVPPTATCIVDTFADLLWLDGGVVAGRPLRGDAAASALLTQ
jgi:hypothetical protein